MSNGARYVRAHLDKLAVGAASIQFNAPLGHATRVDRNDAGNGICPESREVGLSMRSRGRIREEPRHRSQSGKRSWPGS